MLNQISPNSRYVNKTRILFITTLISISFFLYLLNGIINNSNTNSHNIFYVKDSIKTNFRSGNLNKGLSHALDAINIRPLQEGNYSPLDFIPDYDKMVNFKKNTSWNPMKKFSMLEFHDLNLQDRCSFYFRQLYSMNNKWSNDYHKLTFDIDDIHIDLKEEKLGSILGDEELIRMHRKKNDVKLALQRLRIYDRCFIQNDNVDISKIFEDTTGSTMKDVLDLSSSSKKRDLNVRSTLLKDTYKEYNQWDLEHRMFPYIKYFEESNASDIIPRIRYGGELLPKGQIPILTDETRLKAKYSYFQYDKTKSFWMNWNRISGNVAHRGVILSFGDKHLKWALKLIMALRYRQNTLPIQIIITKNDLSKNSMEKILFAAQSDEVQIKDKKGNVMKDVFTKQEIIFVDVTNIIDPEFFDNFTGWKSKWLASIFNLFEEYIFLDADAISYVDLNHYFNTKEYNETGTIFFRDRMLEHYLPRTCNALLESVHPMLPESKYFDNHKYIDEEHVLNECEQYLDPNEKIYKQFFADNLLHQMESGLYAIDKTSHIIPLIMGMTLHMLPIEKCSYGDKEFFWLGFLASGHPYAFHPINAGTFGIYQEKKVPYPEIKAEVCSAQIVHLDVDHKMLWTNGGASICKKDGCVQDDWKNDKIEWPKNLAKSEEELQEVYDGPIDPKFAVISWSAIDAWGRQNKACQGYIWCARYEKILREFSNQEMIERGTLVELKGEEYKICKSTNEVWSYFKIEDAGSMPIKGEIY
ncbi:hypothetical protein TBLA_0G03680 [Henningerozyma blattae CBS 6284]|uniref:Alpha-1,3-mannosyltransferase n=1 Tax=Henningerozyma blattae (strain ATCC 34711 / CBS 6284 / DSM 70876 / NBRC 10599 / NRRL Y-10934 / UCD 77-7) TaxID=1071380 RepID=I2H7F0_HENB6|nr:hypothetical protein TBLA_0G03680 [Tetrapisispora blattae CBS 6284]CCH62302.1 hypothetical protein TBLA_0G03680 [Tetrapisispora blattae CBS 6284]